jgi:hypothetical protein
VDITKVQKSVLLISHSASLKLDFVKRARSLRRGATVVKYNGMVARELQLGPARLSCIYMVFAPYLTLSSVHTIHISLEYTAFRTPYFIHLYKYSAAD